MPAEDEDLVRRTAALARLSITDEEAARLAPQFQRILDHFRVLSAADLGEEPDDGAGALRDVLRRDEPRECLSQDDALANAPDRDGEFYSVPKTVGGDR